MWAVVSQETTHVYRILGNAYCGCRNFENPAEIDLHTRSRVNFLGSTVQKYDELKLSLAINKDEWIRILLRFNPPADDLYLIRIFKQPDPS